MSILKKFETRCKDGGIALVAKHGHIVKFIDESGQEQTYEPDYFCPDSNIIYEVRDENDPERSHRRKSVRIWCQLRGFGYTVVEHRHDGDFYIVANLPPPEVSK